MTYTEAVALALAGEERGFQFLYEESYKSKYYLALQYMKSKEAAEDVLQDAYIRAFRNLQKLQEPEAFEKWLGVIVANTAKNALAKNNPILFTDVAVDDEGDEFVYDVEDENPENQPELAYTREETRTLVHELMDSLSEEQKMCILMFHIEGASISEIAQAMNCSENTVKSRLNYGRKNIKIKAEELQKKGYKLYSVAPVLLLIYLLRLDAKTVSASTEVAVARKQMEETIRHNWNEQVSRARQQENAARVAEKYAKKQGETAGSTSAGAARSGARMAEPVKTAAADTVKTGFLHTVAGKIAVAALAVCVAGGAFYGGMQWNTHRTGQETETAETPKVPEDLKITTGSAVSESSETTEAESTSVVSSAVQKPAADPIPTTEGGEIDFAQIMEGELSQAELEYVLAYGPESIPSEGFTEDSLVFVMNSLCQGTDGNGKQYLNAQKWDDQSRGIYAASEVNRFISSFTEFQYPGDTVALYISTLNYEASAHIYGSKFTSMGEEIDVGFQYHKVKYDDGEQTTDTDKVAVLKPTASGKYRITEIRDASADEFSTTDTPAETTTDTAGGTDEINTEAAASSIRELYEKVLQDVQDGQYSFMQSGNSSTYQYFVADINGDSIPELGVALMMEDTAFYAYDLRMFTCTEQAGGYQLVEVPGEETVENLCVAGDGNGMFSKLVERASGMISVYRVTISSGSLVTGDKEQSFRLDQKAAKDFNKQNPMVDWLDVTDTSGLDSLS